MFTRFVIIFLLLTTIGSRGVADEFKDQKIKIVKGTIRELKDRKKELMEEIRSANPGVGVNFEPYLRNRYDEMREIPYQERTQQQK